MKKYLFLALSVCLLNACSSDGEEDIQNTGPVAIALSAKSLSIEVDTKAPYIGTTPTEAAPLKARIISSMTPGDYTADTGKRHSNGTMTFKGTDETPYDDGAVNPYYPADNSTLYFIGLFPHSGWTESPTTTAAFTFDGKTDVMYAREQSTNKNAIIEGEAAPALVFEHQLTLLYVYMQAENNNAKNAWGTIDKIELVKAKTDKAKNTVTVKINAEDGEDVTTFSSVPATEGEDTPISFYGASEATDGETTTITYSETALSDYTLTVPGMGESAPLVAYSMVEPITATGNIDYTLKFYSSNYTAGREVGISLIGLDNQSFTNNTQGKSFKITLTFGATEIKATASVVAWEESGKAEQEVK